eukprot:m.248172 g.248172  ORF g.248172 m.248172 type:complete len:235 (+) comp15409_c0_seq2:225-929(+)
MAISMKQRAKPVRPTNKKMSQLVLDAGQRRALTTCAICGMKYKATKVADIQEHKKHHKHLAQPQTLSRTYISKHALWRSLANTTSILKYEASAPSSIKIKIEKAIQTALSQMSAGIDPSSCQQVLVYTQGVKVVGLLAFEHIQGAMKCEASAKPDNITCSDVSVPARLGIRLVWVHPSMRRKGVATQLLDTARQRAIYGCSIPKMMLAFSSPTLDGARLARQYTGQQDFLVYPG